MKYGSFTHRTWIKQVSQQDKNVLVGEVGSFPVKVGIGLCVWEWVWVVGRGGVFCGGPAPLNRSRGDTWPGSEGGPFISVD